MRDRLTVPSISDVLLGLVGTVTRNNRAGYGPIGKRWPEEPPTVRRKLKQSRDMYSGIKCHLP